MTLLFFHIFLIVMLLFILFSFALPGLSLAPIVVCRKQDLERVHRLAQLEKGQCFYELGCGTGRVCWYMARKNPDAQIVGMEMSPMLFVWAKIYGKMLGYENVTIVYGNVLEKDLSGADVLYTFALTSTVNEKLAPKLKKEMKKGATFLSYVFRIHDWPGVSNVDKPSDQFVSIFVYKK